MPGLRLILTTTRGEQADAAIELAAATAALGRPVAILLRGSALETAPETLTMLLELGCTITACQTAMAATGVAADALPAGVEPGGMVSFLAGGADWQLLLV